VLPIRKWRESLRDLRRLEVEGAIFAVDLVWWLVGWLMLVWTMMK
jgi:hypothetical protein